MCDWRKLPRRVTSRPEIEISDKRSAFSSQTSPIEPSYKTGPKQVKMSISPIAQGFLKKFRVQNVALTARRPKHPCLVWCNRIFLCETFSRLVPRDSNLGHHSVIRWPYGECFFFCFKYVRGKGHIVPRCSSSHARLLNVLRTPRTWCHPYPTLSGYASPVA
jgi:hypothetical protein